MHSKYFKSRSMCVRLCVCVVGSEFVCQLQTFQNFIYLQKFSLARTFIYISKLKVVFTNTNSSASQLIIYSGIQRTGTSKYGEFKK